MIGILSRREYLERTVTIIYSIKKSRKSFAMQDVDLINHLVLSIQT